VQEADIWPNKSGNERTKRTVLCAYFMGWETDEEFEARKEKLLREHIARIKQEKVQLKMLMQKYGIPVTEGFDARNLRSPLYDGTIVKD
jgi:hypothetical protein